MKLFTHQHQYCHLQYQCFFQYLKHFWNSLFDMAFISFNNSVLISSMVAKVILSWFSSASRGSHVWWIWSMGHLSVDLGKKFTNMQSTLAGALLEHKSHELFSHKFHGMSQSICQNHQQLLWLWSGIFIGSWGERALRTFIFVNVFTAFFKYLYHS